MNIEEFSSHQKAWVATNFKLIGQFSDFVAVHTYQCACLYLMGFPCGSAGKESSCNAGNLGSIPGLGRFPEEGKGYPLQYSGLETSLDCIVHRVTKHWTQLSNFQNLLLLIYWS